MPKSRHITVPQSDGRCCCKEISILLVTGDRGATPWLSGLVHSYHSYIILRALAKRSRSNTPSPPKSLGLQTLSQLTLHFFPLKFPHLLPKGICVSSFEEVQDPVRVLYCREGANLRSLRRYYEVPKIQYKILYLMVPHNT